jgi:hypothetical protein
MEFLVIKLEGESAMPDSIFGILENRNRGRLPPPADWPLV